MSGHQFKGSANPFEDKKKYFVFKRDKIFYIWYGFLLSLTSRFLERAETGISTLICTRSAKALRHVPFDREDTRKVYKEKREGWKESVQLLVSPKISGWMGEEGMGVSTS